MFLKIADFCFDVTIPQKFMCDIYNNYICDETDIIDSHIEIEKEDCIAEYNFSNKYGGATDSKTELCSLAVCRKICAFGLTKDAFLMHGALVEYEGKGYLFTANSGVGKTTHVKLWQEVFGDSVNIVNGDKPILRFIDGAVYGYGTPWCGKEGYNINTSVKLCGICFIERADENSITELDADSALLRVLSQVMIADSADLGKQLELVDRLLNTVPTYLLKCNMNPEAANVAYNGMKKAVQ